MQPKKDTDRWSLIKPYQESKPKAGPVKSVAAILRYARKIDKYFGGYLTFGNCVKFVISWSKLKYKPKLSIRLRREGTEKEIETFLMKALVPYSKGIDPIHELWSERKSPITMKDTYGLH